MKPGRFFKLKKHLSRRNDFAKELNYLKVLLLFKDIFLLLYLKTLRTQIIIVNYEKKIFYTEKYYIRIFENEHMFKWIAT